MKTVEDQIDTRATDAEDAIQKLLLELEDKTGKRIDQVQVDTRNFANCRVDISFR